MVVSWIELTMFRWAVRNIIKVFTSFEDAYQLYLVMEWTAVPVGGSWVGPMARCQKPPLADGLILLKWNNMEKPNSVIFWWFMVLGLQVYRIALFVGLSHLPLIRYPAVFHFGWLKLVLHEAIVGCWNSSELISLFVVASPYSSESKFEALG